MTSRPNFFIAGAPKAGTDTLYYQLSRHPEIYTSPLKEPCYFSSEIRPENFAAELQEQMEVLYQATKQYINGDMRERRFGGIVSDWNDYLRLFEGVGHQSAIGEGSVCYLWSKSAAKGIASQLPDSKIIIVLMDPAERAFAQYRKSLSDGNVQHSFRDHLEHCFRNSDDRFSPYYPFLEFGLYSKQLERYLSLFPRKQISISLYEDVTRDYDQWFSQILNFLGVDAGFALARSELSPGERPTVPIMPLEDRAALVEYYSDDIRKVQQLTGYNLASWL